MTTPRLTIRKLEATPILAPAPVPMKTMVRKSRQVPSRLSPIQVWSFTTTWQPAIISRA